MKVERNHICLFCSLGCGFTIESVDDEAVNLEYDTADEVGRGSLCAKGNFMLELLNHPERLTEPRNREKTLTWDKTLETMKDVLEPRLDRSEVGLIIEGDALREDISAAVRFAETCLGKDCCAVHYATGDDLVYRALLEASIPNPPVRLEDIERSACTIAVGDPFEIGPVISGRVLDARYASRKNILAVIADTSNMTSRFANLKLMGPVRTTLAGLLRVVVEETGGNEPAWKQAVRDAYPIPEDTIITDLGRKFVRTPSSFLILETQDPIAAQLAAAVVAASGSDKRLFTLGTYGNCGDICELSPATVTADTLMTRARDGHIKGFIVLGADIARGPAGETIGQVRKQTDFIWAGAPFDNGTTQIADLVLPTAIWLESEGTIRGEKRTPVVGFPGGALPYGEILRRLAHKLGRPLNGESPEPAPRRKEINGELIRRLAKEIGFQVPEPVIRSTSLRYADGAITDAMSWIRLQERSSW